MSKCHVVLQIVDEFRQAARNAMDAGFNGVEIHGANVSLFYCMSSCINRGQEQYCEQCACIEAVASTVAIATGQQQCVVLQPMYCKMQHSSCICLLAMLLHACFHNWHK